MRFRRSLEVIHGGFYFYMLVIDFSMVLTFFLRYFSVVCTRVSSSSSSKRQGINNDEICRIIAAKVAVVAREAIPELLGSVKTAMIKIFDESYTVVTKVAATAVIGAMKSHGGDLMQY